MHSPVLESTQRSSTRSSAFEWLSHMLDISQEIPVVSQSQRLRSYGQFCMHETDLGFNVKACLEVLNGKYSHQIPGDWQWEMCSKGQPHLIGAGHYYCVLWQGTSQRNWPFFSLEICYDRFFYKSLWVRAAPMRLNTPKMSPQTDAVSLCKKNE